MNKSQDFHDYLMSDVFNGIGGVTSKRMFGGFGIYKNGIIFAITDKDQIYFKVGESNQKEYEDYGCKPFEYPMKNDKMTSLSYWELPVDILEDKEKLLSWIDKSVEVSKTKIKK